MKRTIVFILIIASTFSYGYSQNQADCFKEDLEFLKINLPQKHVNLFTKISQREFEQQIASIESKIDSLDEKSFFCELFQLITAIGDEHTRIEPQHLFKYTVPIRFTLFKEGIFVTETTQPNIMLAKLLEVNGVAIEEVINQFRKIIYNENPSFFETMLLFYMNNTYILKGLGLTNSAEEVLYTFETKDADTISIKLKPSQNPTMKRAEAFSLLEAYSGEGNYWYRYYPDKNCLYFNYLNCKEDKNYSFEKFCSQLFESISINKPEKLIIDLRYNGGGNSKVLNPFLIRLKNNYLNANGKLYVLIGRMTFSSALLNALNLKQNFNSVLLGQPTAGSINHFGETLTFTLPNTKATVVYSTKYFEEWKGHNGALTPDIQIDCSVKEFNKGKDEVLEYVYRVKD
ncbi:hypothetical protein [Parabacteroides sp. Marseille-P3160]|uniref:hypothetical protein n=1 Tax=Parabacteroides sp. Marseille-P3160 TaxID=1917887 RepID=UPI0009BAC7EE|nr:hypothetical protein [Parabacteroides sp. Marseille-P3160]